MTYSRRLLQWPSRVLALVSVLLALACEPTPPPRWAEGGARLLLADARWQRDGDTIEIRRNGDVLEDGELFCRLDRVGRVVDEDNAPVALLLGDGLLVGTDQRELGQVGRSNAAPPFGGFAWLSVLPTGQVVYYDDEGEPSHGGSWTGCDGAALRTCTLVTHLVALRSYVLRPTSRVGVGVGVGF